MHQPEFDNPKIIFIADYFTHQILGGGELNNEELIELLKIHNSVNTINSNNVTVDYLQNNRENKFIIANFAILGHLEKDYITEHLNYIIYEHDHKYLVTRNPADYPNFKAPKEQIINYNFYKNAKAVLCQSSFHKDIVYKNLKLDNIVSVGGNLWSEKTLQMLEECSLKKKQDVCSIMDSPISHKNTAKTIAYCKYKEMPYELIKSADYHTFLDKLSNNDKLAFFPETPETLSRIVVECRMMGMNTITNKTIGAIGEGWFDLKGLHLIGAMREKRKTIVTMVLGCFR